ncbi:MAG: signal recognition particle protein [Nitrospirae bacterium]|nr:signal recognition particle protein [Nitrospirota bacterium]
MWNALTSKFEAIFKRLRGRGLLDEAAVTDVLREVRLALLEADVHYAVVKTLLESVKARALTQEVLQSLTPGQQVIKIVWEELCALMGQSHRPIQLAPNPPTVVMLVGLQGAGKTTTAAKIARAFHADGRRVLLAAADLKRPAAIRQLEVLGEQVGVPVHAPSGEQTPEAVCRAAVARADRGNIDLVVLDTAGRLQIDEELMGELVAIRESVRPHEVLLVADAMTGQAAVSIAERFNQGVGVTGIVLTKTEGDARGGAMLSMLAVTGKPIKYVGVGEALAALEPFHPERAASRILGMGDVAGLVERAQEVLSRDDARVLDQKLRSDSFTLDDFGAQLQQVKKLGSFSDLLGMIPGGAKLAERVADKSPERDLVRIEAMLSSMTPRERRSPEVINGSRRKRIARGSGTTVQEINQLLKQFAQAKKMMKTLSGPRGRSLAARLFSA